MSDVVQPTEIALDWSNKLLESMNRAIENNKSSLEIGGRFQVVYEIDRWQDALHQALHIYEQSEKYEECAEVSALIERVKIIKLIKH